MPSIPHNLHIHNRVTDLLMSSASMQDLCQYVESEGVLAKEQYSSVAGVTLS